MKTNTIILSIIFLVITIIVSLVVIVNVSFYRHATIPAIYSDTEARDFLQSHFGGIKLPENAHHLYAARRGILMGTIYYGAFSLNSRQECETFFKEKFDISIGDFKKIEELSDHYIYTAPDTWKPKYQDPNWKLQQELEVYYIDESYVEIAFVPEKLRIYMIRSAD